MTIPVYNPEAGPAEYEHRGGDECPAHGPNIPHFRLKGAVGPFYCVQCAQDYAAEQIETTGVRSKVNGALTPIVDRAVEGLIAIVTPKPTPLEHAGNGHAELPSGWTPVERTTVELQRDLAVQTAECARLQAELAAVTAERDGYYRLLVGLRDDVANLAHDIMTALAKTGETKT
jgi:hypothetical protein